MIKPLIVFIIIFLSPFSILAADILDLLNGKAANYDRQQRKELVIEFKNLFTNLDNAIPSLKPSEQEWVNKERNAIASMTNKENRINRLVNLHESVEFQQENIKRLTKSILKTTNCIIQAEEIRREIHYWSLLSFFLTDKEEFDYAIAMLKEGKKIYKSTSLYFGGPLTGYGSFYNSFGRSINEYFVIPYLAGELKK